jgi:hypothetical protein
MAILSQHTTRIATAAILLPLLKSKLRSVISPVTDHGTS